MTPKNSELYTTPRRSRKALAGALTELALTLSSACSGGAEEEEFTGGCERFAVYAQNRWAPLGTAVREEPDALSTKLDPSFAPNEVIAVDGWYETSEPVYETNPAPWDSGVWFRLATREGWVSFAGVRGAPTVPDETLMSDYGGEPAPLPTECELTSQEP